MADAPVPSARPLKPVACALSPTATADAPLAFEPWPTRVAPVEVAVLAWTAALAIPALARLAWPSAFAVETNGACAPASDGSSIVAVAPSPVACAKPRTVRPVSALALIVRQPPARPFRGRSQVCGALLCG